MKWTDQNELSLNSSVQSATETISPSLPAHLCTLPHALSLASSEALQPQTTLSPLIYVPVLEKYSTQAHI